MEGLVICLGQCRFRPVLKWRLGIPRPWRLQACRFIRPSSMPLLMRRSWRPSRWPGPPGPAGRGRSSRWRSRSIKYPECCSRRSEWMSRQLSAPRSRFHNCCRFSCSDWLPVCGGGSNASRYQHQRAERRGRREPRRRSAGRERPGAGGQSLGQARLCHDPMPGKRPPRHRNLGHGRATRYWIDWPCGARSAVDRPRRDGIFAACRQAAPGPVSLRTVREPAVL